MVAQRHAQLSYPMRLFARPGSSLDDLKGVCAVCVDKATSCIQGDISWRALESMQLALKS